MERSTKTAAAAIVGAGIGLAVTQTADLSLTAPFEIGPDIMRGLLPLALALVPIVLQMFAPGLLPLWERFKGLFVPDAEAADFKALSRVAAINPDCPVWQGHCKSLAGACYAKHHPAPEIPVDTRTTAEVILAK